jgi:hypothetical protein
MLSTSYEYLHYVCLGRFIKERNKKERDGKEISNFYCLDKGRIKREREIKCKITVKNPLSILGEISVSINVDT